MSSSSPSDSSNSTPDTPPVSLSTPSTDIINLKFKPAKLFAAGTGFVILSALTTRRALVRRRLALTPHYYQYSPSLTLNPFIRLPPNVREDAANGARRYSSAIDAFEALQLATLNVLSVAMMAFGAAAWWFDIKSLDELRMKLRAQMATGGGERDEEAERQIEEWVASILGKKEEREKKETEGAAQAKK